MGAGTTLKEEAMKAGGVFGRESMGPCRETGSISRAWRWSPQGGEAARPAPGRSQWAVQGVATFEIRQTGCAACLASSSC